LQVPVSPDPPLISVGVDLEGAGSRWAAEVVVDQG
jgi:hypothetical protein